MKSPRRLNSTQDSYCGTNNANVPAVGPTWSPPLKGYDIHELDEHVEIATTRHQKQSNNAGTRLSFVGVGCDTS